MIFWEASVQYAQTIPMQQCSVKMAELEAELPVEYVVITGRRDQVRFVLVLLFFFLVYRFLVQVIYMVKNYV